MRATVLLLLIAVVLLVLLADHGEAGRRSRFARFRRRARRSIRRVRRRVRRRYRRVRRRVRRRYRRVKRRVRRRYRRVKRRVKRRYRRARRHVRRRASYRRVCRVKTKFRRCVRRLLRKCGRGYRRRGRKCYKIRCPRGFLRRGKSCVRRRASRRRALRCRRGYRKVGRRCYRIRRIKCRWGYRRYKGRCVLYKCPRGYKKMGSSCRRACRSGYHFRGRRCVRKVVRCPRFHYKWRGKCRRFKRGTSRCPRKYRRVRGKCVRRKVSCPRHYRRVGRRCVRRCPRNRIPRKTRTGLRCVPIRSKCRTGYRITTIRRGSKWRAICRLIRGRCRRGYKRRSAKGRSYCVRITCPRGYRKRGRRCFSKSGCRRGYSRIRGACRRLNCPSGYVRRGGLCIRARCPRSYRRVGRLCVKSRLVGHCPKGWKRHGSLCRRLTCPSGYSKVGSYCVSTSCPSGFVRRGKFCRKTSCGAGYVKRGQLCIRRCPKNTKATKFYCIRRSCPKNFRKSGAACVRYRCPKGYITRRMRKRVRTGTRITGYSRKCRCGLSKTPARKPRRKRAIDIAFVVDTSGSMGSVINAIKSSINKVIRSNSKLQVIDRFVLVPFRDPSVGPVFVASSRSRRSLIRLVKALRRLRAKRGGDCPEMSNSGMYQAIKRVKKGSVIYVFTDASAKRKDKVKRRQVMRLAARKSVQLNFLISGRLCKNPAEYRDLARSTKGSWVRIRPRYTRRVLRYISKAIRHGASGLRRLNRNSLSSFIIRRKRCFCSRKASTAARYRTVSTVKCLVRPKLRCPAGYRRVSRRVRKASSRRRVAGFVKKCRCMGVRAPRRVKQREVDIAFVIDVTGSMGKVIKGIRQRIRSVIAANQRSGNIDNIVLTPYSDPWAGPARSYSSRSRRHLSKMLRLIQKIRATGGRDCPEFSHSAIFKTAKVVKPGSIIYVFTDASASRRDKIKKSKVLSIIRRKKLQVNFLITGNLCRRRNAYRDIAKISKGAWVKMSDRKVSRVVQFLSQAMAHGAKALRRLNRSALARLSRSSRICKCKRVRKSITKYTYVRRHTCVKRSAGKRSRFYIIYRRRVSKIRRWYSRRVKYLRRKYKSNKKLRRRYIKKARIGLRRRLRSAKSWLRRRIRGRKPRTGKSSPRKCGRRRCRRGERCVRRRSSRRIRSLRRRLSAAKRSYTRRLRSAAKRLRRDMSRRRRSVSTKARRSVACEGSSTTIKCPSGYKIQVIRGFYGRTTNRYCARGPRRNMRCKSRVANARIARACNNRRVCRVRSSNSVFGDPCRGTYKYATVLYKCRKTVTTAAKVVRSRHSRRLRSLRLRYARSVATLRKRLRKAYRGVRKCVRRNPCKRRRCRKGYRCVVSRKGRRLIGRCIRKLPKNPCRYTRCGRRRRCVVRRYRRRVGRKIVYRRKAVCLYKRNMCSKKKCPKGRVCRVRYQRRSFYRRVRRYVRKCSCKGALSMRSKPVGRKRTIDIAFVVDTTGSMGSVISSIKKNIAEIVRANSKSKTVRRFVLVAYNDPKVGPVTVTSSESKLVAAVGRLRASGGGDCPERSMSGLLLAANAVMRNSIIYLFTDASASDNSRRSLVLRQMRAKRLQLVVIASGGLCGRKGLSQYRYLTRRSTEKGKIVSIKRIGVVLSFIKRALTHGAARLRAMNRSKLTAFTRKCRCRRVRSSVRTRYYRYVRAASCVPARPSCKTRKCSRLSRCVVRRYRVGKRLVTTTRCVPRKVVCPRCRKGFKCAFRYIGVRVRRGSRSVTVRRRRAYCRRYKRNPCSRIRCGRFRKCILRYRRLKSKRYAVRAVCVSRRLV